MDTFQGVVCFLPTVPTICKSMQLNNLHSNAVHDVLTNLPLDKMTAIAQTVLSDVFSWMKSFLSGIGETYMFEMTLRTL